MVLPREAPWRLRVKGFDGAAQRGSLVSTSKPPTFPRLHRRAGFGGFSWTNEPHRGGNSQPPRWQPGPACTLKGSLPPERHPRGLIVTDELTAQPWGHEMHSTHGCSTSISHGIPLPCSRKGCVGQWPPIVCVNNIRWRKVDNHSLCTFLWTHRGPGNTPVTT